MVLVWVGSTASNPGGGLGFSPRMDLAYQRIGGIHFSEDFKIDEGIRVNSERDLTGYGIRFGVGADIPLGYASSWSLGFGLGGTYMKNTVDQTRTATDSGIEIGSIDNSASTTNLNLQPATMLVDHGLSFLQTNSQVKWKSVI